MLTSTPNPRNTAPILAGSMPLMFGRRGHTPNPRGIHFDLDDKGGGGSGGGDDDDGGGGDDKGGNDDKPSFTQKQVDDIVERRLATERRKWDKDFQTKLQDELGKLNKSDDKGKGKGKDDEPVMPKSEFENLKKQLEEQHGNTVKELNERITALLDEKRAGAIVAAVADLSPVNAKQVAKLAGDLVSFDDDGHVIVLDEKTGKARYGTDGNYLTVEAYMAEFAKANPHLFKADMAGGAGGKGGGNPAGKKQELPSTGIGKIAMGIGQGALKPRG